MAERKKTNFAEALRKGLDASVHYDRFASVLTGLLDSASVEVSELLNVDCHLCHDGCKIKVVVSTSDGLKTWALANVKAGELGFPVTIASDNHVFLAFDVDGLTEALHGVFALPSTGAVFMDVVRSMTRSGSKHTEGDGQGGEGGVEAQSSSDGKK